MKSYVCLLSNDNYLLGLLVLNENLKKVNSKYPLLCLVSQQVSENCIKIISSFGINYKIIPYIDYNPNSEIQYNHWTYSFDKINIYSLTEYEKLVYLDLDLLLLENVDDLFDIEGNIAMARDYPFHEDGYNAGIMVVKPNEQDYNNLKKLAMSCNNVYGDQTVFNEYFKDISIIPKEYDVMTEIISETVLAYDNVYKMPIAKYNVNTFSKRYKA